MKKLFTLLTMLIIGIGSTWATSFEVSNPVQVTDLAQLDDDEYYILQNVGSSLYNYYDIKNSRLDAKSTYDYSSVVQLIYNSSTGIVYIKQLQTGTYYQNLAKSRVTLGASVANFTFNTDDCATGLFRFANSSLYMNRYGGGTQYPQGAETSFSGNYSKWKIYKVTVSPFDGTITYSTTTGLYTSTNSTGTWAATWKAYGLGLTLSVGANNINVSDGNIHSGDNGCTYTLTAPDGYLITGYTISGTSQTGEQTDPQTLTPEAGGSATTFATSGTTTLTVSGIATGKTTFYHSSPNNGIALSSFTVSLTKINPVTSLGNLSNSKCYNIINNRGWWAVASDASEINSTSELSLAPLASDTKQQFAIISYEHNETTHYYLYSVSEGKYAYVDGTKLSLTSTVTPAVIVTSPVTFNASTFSQNATFPVVISVGGKNYGVSTGHDPDIYNYESLSDEGNASAICEAGDFDATEVIAAIDEYYSTTVQYVIKDTGGNTLFTSDEYSATVGDEITDADFPSECEREFCTYDVEETTVVVGLNSVPVTVSYDFPFTVSSDFASATWYYATLRGKYLRADDDAKDGSGRYSTNSTNEHTDAYKWAFFGNPYDGFYVMNKAQGDSKYLYKETQLVFKSGITPTEDNAALFAVTSNSNGGFTLRNIAGGSTWYVNDAGNLGNLGFWNDSRGANDAGSNWVITEVPTVDVTYNFEVDDETVNTIVVENVPEYSEVAVPSGLTNGYTTFAYNFENSGTIGGENSTITVTGTLKDGLVKVGDLSNSKKYKLTCVRGSLSTYDDNGTVYLASPTKTSLEIEGKEFAIINHSDKNYLYSVSDGKFVTYSDDQHAPLTTKPATTDAISFSETSKSVYKIMFDNSSSKIINSSASYTYGIVINDWGSITSEYDDGNQYVIEEIDDFDPTSATGTLTYNNIIANLKAIRWGLTSEGNKWKLNYYNFIGNTYGGFAGLESALIAEKEDEGYSAENLQAVQGMSSNYALNMPTTGKFYRIQGSTSSKYLASGSASNGKYNMTNADDASTIFYYDADSKLTNLGSGMCNGVLSNSWAWTTGENASTVTFQNGLSNGGYAIKSAKANNDNNANFYDDGDNSSSADRGGNVTINSNTNARYTHWYLTEITSLPVAFDENALGYATFDCPVAVKLPTDVEAYVCQINESTIKLYKADQVKDGDNWVLPANTPVLLYNTDMENKTTQELTITSTEEEYTNNGFYGTTVAESPNTTDYLYYALRKKTNEKTVGFYQRANQSSTLRGFRAWIRDEKQNARNFTIVFDGDSDPTGIVEALGLENDNVEIYDLNGRKLSSYQKGINIVNGKKVFK